MNWPAVALGLVLTVLVSLWVWRMIWVGSRGEDGEADDDAEL